MDKSKFDLSIRYFAEWVIVFFLFVMNGRVLIPILMNISDNTALALVFLDAFLTLLAVLFYFRRVLFVQLPKLLS